MRAKTRYSLKRQWTVFLVPFCHVDIGYSNTQEDVLKLHKLNLDGKVNARGEKVGVLDLIDATADYPEEARFKFTSECSWPVIEFLNDPNISQERKEKLISHMQKKEIEVCAFLINHTNKFMGPEMFVRSTLFACEHLKRKYNVSATSAMMNDVGDASGVVPPLASSGVKYFFYGPNSLHYALPPLFYLRCPSGGERKILTWITPNLSAYGENIDLGLRPPLPSLPFFAHKLDGKLPDYEERIFRHLHWLENDGVPLEGPWKKKRWNGARFPYPYDAYLVPYYPAHAGDNGHQDITPCEIVKKWNETYENPKMKVAALREFYDYVEEKFSSEIPSHSIDFTGFWGEQIFFSMSHIDPEKIPGIRKFEQDVLSAEKFYSFLKPVAKNLPSVAEKTQDAFKKAILLTDHNPCPVSFSGNKFPQNSSGIPYTEKDVEVWKQTKQTWLAQIGSTAQNILDSVFHHLFSAIKFENENTRILLLNSLSWERNDAVRLSIPPSCKNFSICREDTGENVLFQILEEDQDGTQIVFQADKVPSHGYVVYKILPDSRLMTSGPDVKATQEQHFTEVENQYYSLTLGTNINLSISLKDKQTGQSIFEQASLEPLFLFRRETLGGGFLLPLPRFLVREKAVKSLRVAEIKNGPVCAVIEMEGETNQNPGIPFYLSLAAKAFAGVVGGNNASRRPSLPEAVKFSIVMHHHIKRMDFQIQLRPVASQVLEMALPLPFHGKFQKMIMQSGYQQMDLLNNSEAKAVPLKKSAVTFFNFPFLWIQDYPPDNVFWNYAGFSSNEGHVYFSSRESGMLLFNDKKRLLEGETLYHLILGPTYFGNFLLGEPSSKGLYELSSMLTSGDSHGEYEKICLNYQYPLMAKVLQTPENKAGSFPLCGSFLSLSKNDHVRVTAFKESEDKEGVIIRLHEFKGKRDKVNVALHLNLPISSFLSNSSEEKIRELSVEQATHSFTLSIEPFGLETVKIIFLSALVHKSDDA